VLVVPFTTINLNGEVYLEEPSDFIEQGFEVGDSELIIEGYRRLLDSDTLNIDYNFNYVKQICLNEDISSIKELKSKYQYYLRNESQEIRDLSNLMSGFMDYYSGNRIDYSSTFDKVRGDSLKYLNYGYGLVYYQEDNFLEAEKYFLAELERDWEFEEVAITLFSMYYYEGPTEKLKAIVYHPKVHPYLDVSYKMKAYFGDGAWIPYFREAVYRDYFTSNWFGFFGALLAALVWVLYLRGLDVFEPEKWRNIVGVFCFGSIFSILVYPFSDFLDFYIGINPEGSSWRELFYCIVDIGMVEELVKFLPWFLVLKFTKIIDEPFDYIFYAALSGAGFAFAENLIYFQEVDLDIIFVRATYCIVGHMFWSSTVAYGYILYKYKYKQARSKIYLIPVAFVLASIGHGLYDFFIFQNIGMLSVVFFIGSLHLFVVFQNNALNVSNHFSYQIKLNTRKIGVQLIFGLIAVFMYQYVVIGLRYGSNDANNMLMYSATSVSFMLAYLTYTFSQIKISKGTWLKIAMPHWLSQGRNILKRFRLGIDYDAESAEEKNNVGMKIRFFAPKDNPYLGKQLPVTGVLIKKIEVSGSDDWYLVLLDSPLHLNTCLSDRVIVRHKNKGQSLQMDKVLIYFMMIPSEYELHKNPLLTRDLLFTGRVYSRPV